MKEVTKELIRDFDIKQKGYDFMGYEKQQGDIYTFHHALIPNRKGGPYAYWNGVILFSTPHQYLHTIEAIDYQKFAYLTSEMHDMKIKEWLDPHNIENINEILLDFEYHNEGRHSRKGHEIIKPQYKRRVLTKGGRL